jgi:hypothetical protein
MILGDLGPAIHDDPERKVFALLLFIHMTWPRSHERGTGRSFRCVENKPEPHRKPPPVVLPSGSVRTWAPAIATRDGRYFYYYSADPHGGYPGGHPGGTVQGPAGYHRFLCVNFVVHLQCTLPMNRGFHRWTNRGLRGWARIRALAVVHGPRACSSDKATFHEPSPLPCPRPLGRVPGGRVREPSRCTVPGPKACSLNKATFHEPSTANRGFHRWINRGYRGWARIRVLASPVVRGPKARSTNKPTPHEPRISPMD